MRSLRVLALLAAAGVLAAAAAPFVQNDWVAAGAFLKQQPDSGFAADLGSVEAQDSSGAGETRTVDSTTVSGAAEVRTCTSTWAMVATCRRAGLVLPLQRALPALPRCMLQRG